MNSQVHQQPKVPTQTGETKKKSANAHCSKAAQLVKRQIESKSKVDKPRKSEERDDAALISKYSSNPHQ